MTSFATNAFHSHKIILFLLSVELVILIVLLLLIVLERIINSLREKNDLAANKKILELIIEHVEEKKQFDPKGDWEKIKSQEQLLNQMELFDKRLSGNEWDSLKKNIARAFLLPYARKLVKNHEWTKRMLAARCFALSPLPEDQADMFSLIDDPVFLIRRTAASAAMKLDNKEAIIKIIHRLSQEFLYTRFFYRDILLHEKSMPILKWIEEIASTEKDETIHITCLDLLADESFDGDFPFLAADMKSENPKIRLAAIKVHESNPQTNSSQVLVNSLQDPEEEIRAHAALGLQNFATKENIKHLQAALSDQSWLVRSQAAKSLKIIGENGIEILKKQNPELDPSAYEAAQYALELNW